MQYHGISFQFLSCLCISLSRALLWIVSRFHLVHAQRSLRSPAAWLGANANQLPLRQQKPWIWLKGRRSAWTVSFWVAEMELEFWQNGGCWIWVLLLLCVSVAQGVFLVKVQFNSLIWSIEFPNQGADCLFVTKVIWSACWSFQKSFVLTSLIISRLMLLIYAIMFRSLPLGIKKSKWLSWCRLHVNFIASHWK